MTRSSKPKKQVGWAWSLVEDNALIEACTRFGGRWSEVADVVPRSIGECEARWSAIMPTDWKSFQTLDWPDEDLLRLVQAVRSTQFDNEKKCFIPSKQCDWSVIAAIVNVDEWRWDAAKCEQAWNDLQALPPSRLGAFTKLEDTIIAERVLAWGVDQRRLWPWLSGALKRDPIVLRNRWKMINKSYVNFKR